MCVRERLLALLRASPYGSAYNRQPMPTLKLLILTFFLLIGILSILKPVAAARMTVKGLKWLMNVVGLKGDLIATPRVVSFLRWWNVLMLGVTLMALLSIVVPSSFR